MRALDNMNYKRVKKIFMNDGTAGAEDSSSFDNDDDISSQVFFSSSGGLTSSFYTNCTVINPTGPFL